MNTAATVFSIIFMIMTTISAAVDSAESVQSEYEINLQETLK